jgi:ferredoxin
VLDTKDFGKFVAALRRGYRVYGPVREGRATELRELTGDAAADFGYVNFRLPLKRHFFPQSEVIARWSGEGMADEPRVAGRSVLFGIRPCDARSVTLLDRVFIDDQYADPFYQQRRESTLIIALACGAPAATCFCTSTSGGPAATEGADIVAFHIAPSLLFEPVTDAGRALIETCGSLLREPTEAQRGERERQQAEAEKNIAGLPVAKAVERLHGDIDTALWETTAQPCLSCGACALLCPTCHCFGFHDEGATDSGVRLRVHDTCQFESFTREASGHNPRGAAGQRTRQRIMHKFSYAPDMFGEVFCVGCGRCICNCPGGGDIRETISKVAL